MRCFLLIFLGARLLGEPVPAHASEPVRIVGVEPTVLFPNAQPLSQVARATVDNDSSTPRAVDIVVKVSGHVPSVAQRTTLPPGRSRQNALVPDLTAPAEVTVVIVSDGRVLASHPQRWQPQRKWKVYLVKSSREDIGYENFLWIKQKEIADYIDLGRRLSTPGSATAPTRASNLGGDRYWLETLLFPRYTKIRWWIAGLRFLATVITYVDRQTLSIPRTTLRLELLHGHILTPPHRRGCRLRWFFP